MEQNLKASIAQMLHYQFVSDCSRHYCWTKLIILGLCHLCAGLEFRSHTYYNSLGVFKQSTKYAKRKKKKLWRKSLNEIKSAESQWCTLLALPSKSCVVTLSSSQKCQFPSWLNHHWSSSIACRGVESPSPKQPASHGRFLVKAQIGLSIVGYRFSLY